jgi:hypothetical protein
MKKILFAFILLIWTSFSIASDIGIGQYGIEWGKKWNHWEVKLNGSVSGFEFNRGISRHFEIDENYRPWFFYRILSRDILELKLGVGALVDLWQTKDFAEMTGDFLFEFNPFSYEVEAKVTSRVSMTATDGFLRIWFEENGIKYYNTEFGNFLPKIGLRYYF